MRFAVKLSNISFSTFRVDAPGVKMCFAAAAQHRSTSAFGNRKKSFLWNAFLRTYLFHNLYFKLLQKVIFDSFDPAEWKVEVNYPTFKYLISLSGERNCILNVLHF